MSRKIGNRSQPLNDSHKKDNLRALVNGYLFFLLKIAKVPIIPSLLLPSVLILKWGQQFSLWQNLCSKGNKGIEEMVSIINRIAVGQAFLPVLLQMTGKNACPTAILIMTFLPHKYITTHHGDTETQRKIEG